MTPRGTTWCTPMRDPFALAHGRLGPSAYSIHWAALRDAVPGTRPAKSPLKLAQEMVGDDPWRGVVAAMMHVQTARRTAHPTLWELLARWPDAERMAVASKPDLIDVLEPCGFQNRRAHALIRSAMQWCDDYRPPDLYGAGRYVTDSYRIFALGDLRCSPLDRELAAYVCWALRSGSK